MTRALLLLIAGLLSACQAGEPAPSPEAAGAPADGGITAEYVAALPAGQSRPAVQQLANEAIAAVTEACNEDADIDWDACVSTRMLVAFDRYGFLASHCRDKPDHKSLRDCVQFGRSGVDWVLALGENPDADFDWSNPEQSHMQALTRLNDTLTRRCAGKREEPGNSCFTGVSAELLRLGEVVAERCAARATLDERGACIMDAHDAGMYRAALRVLASW